MLSMFNNILTTGQIPLEWKIALLYPIPKPTAFQSRLVNM